MSTKKSNNVGIILMALATVACALVLVFFPNLISGFWKIVAWSATGVAGTATGVLKHVETKNAKLLEEKELARIRRKRMQQLKKDREEREARIEKAHERAAAKEADRTAKQMEIKAQLAEEAKTTWVAKEKYASDQETLARDIIKGTNDMAIRTLAGSVAIEWNEAGSLAQWTAKELIMFSQRPNVTSQARDDAQAAIIEAAGIKAAGNNLTEEQGLQLHEKKEKAREEAQIEEDRLDAIKDVIENAELKWKVAEMRASRVQDELDALNKKK